MTTQNDDMEAAMEAVQGYAIGADVPPHAQVYS